MTKLKNLKNMLLNRTSSLRRLSEKIPTAIILLTLCAFFASWGAGLQKITSFDLSKIFVGLTLLVILYWLLSVEHKFSRFPHWYNYFILYIVIHTIVVYVFFAPGELKFSYLGEEAARCPRFVVMLESNGIRILRVLLFATLAYAVASLIRTKKQLILFALAYAGGLFSATALGTYAISDRAGSFTQHAGGFLSPSGFGTAALTAAMLSLYVFFANGRWYLKTLAIALFIASVRATVLSISRSSMLSLGVGLACVILFVPDLKGRVQVFALIVLACIILLGSVPKNHIRGVRHRVNVKQTLDRGGSYRLDLWKAYLARYQRYILTGVGMHRSNTVINDATTVDTSKGTHNTYLQTLVEFGVIGLVLFFLSLASLLQLLLASKLIARRNRTGAVMLGFLISWATVFIFTNVYTSRALWLSFGVIAVYASLGKDSEEASGAMGTSAAEKQLTQI